MLFRSVYIRLTRGQESLVIHDQGESRDGGPISQAQDLLVYDLPVVAPSDDEIKAHEAVLLDLDKACGGRSLWRSAVAQ